MHVLRLLPSMDHAVAGQSGNAANHFRPLLLITLSNLAVKLQKDADGGSNVKLAFERQHLYWCLLCPYQDARTAASSMERIAAPTTTAADAGLYQITSQWLERHTVSVFCVHAHG
jgi:hypothetical protein